MTKTDTNQKNGKPMTMAELLAGQSFSTKTFQRGQEVEGQVIQITATDIIVDLSAKTEGVINIRDLSADQLKELKVGDKISAYVVIPETESGQTILSLFKQVSAGKRPQDIAKWQKYITAMQRKSQLTGKVVEVNKGGLVVEMDKVRGFIPASQVGSESLSEATGLEGLVGKDLSLMVMEVDPANHRLILSARKQVSDEVKQKLSQLADNQTVVGKVVAVAPFGLVIDLDGLEGVVYSQEVSWEEGSDFAQSFPAGTEIKAKVIGKDESAGKALLSIRQLSEDPFTQKAADYMVDDVVSGTVANISQAGVDVQLADGVNGFVPVDKIEPGNEYTLGQKTNFLVDNVDNARRRINLAPFLTSTKGLIYK